MVKYSSILLFFIIIVLTVTLLLGCRFKQPKEIGVQNGRLKSCPDSPNCVSTRDSDEIHGIEPITFTGTPEEAMMILVEVINSIPRAEIVTQEPLYIYSTFTSKLMRYVDDVQFLVDPDSKTIHFRSASRVGYSDMGVNRTRMEQIRTEFLARQ